MHHSGMQEALWCNQQYQEEEEQKRVGQPAGDGRPRQSPSTRPQQILTALASRDTGPEERTGGDDNKRGTRGSLLDLAKGSWEFQMHNKALASDHSEIGKHGLRRHASFASSHSESTSIVADDDPHDTTSNEQRRLLSAGRFYSLQPTETTSNRSRHDNTNDLPDLEDRPISNRTKMPQAKQPTLNISPPIPRLPGAPLLPSFSVLAQIFSSGINHQHLSSSYSEASKFRREDPHSPHNPSRHHLPSQSSSSLHNIIHSTTTSDSLHYARSPRSSPPHFPARLSSPAVSSFSSLPASPSSSTLIDEQVVKRKRKREEKDITSPAVNEKPARRTKTQHRPKKKSKEKAVVKEEEEEEEENDDALDENCTSSSSSSVGDFGSMNNNNNKRSKTTPEQLAILEKAFEREMLPSLTSRKMLAKQLGFTPRRVQIWFQVQI